MPVILGRGTHSSRLTRRGAVGRYERRRSAVAARRAPAIRRTPPRAARASPPARRSPPPTDGPRRRPRRRTARARRRRRSRPASSRATTDAGVVLVEEDAPHQPVSPARAGRAARSRNGTSASAHVTSSSSSARSQRTASCSCGTGSPVDQPGEHHAEHEPLAVDRGRGRPSSDAVTSIDAAELLADLADGGRLEGLPRLDLPAGELPHARRARADAHGGPRARGPARGSRHRRLPDLAHAANLEVRGPSTLDR